MRKILIFLGIIKPFTHDPRDFRIRAKKWWASEKYFLLQYSANGGRNWKTIRRARPPLFDVSISLNYDWTYEPVRHNLEMTSVSAEMAQFPNYQSILDFHKEQENIYWKGKIEHWEKIKNYYHKLDKNFKS